jgi:hypothetical protein
MLNIYAEPVVTKKTKDDLVYIAIIWGILIALYMIPAEIKRNPASQVLGGLLLIGLCFWHFSRIKDAGSRGDLVETKSRLNDLYFFCFGIAGLCLILLIAEAISPGITRSRP